MRRQERAMVKAGGNQTRLMFPRTVGGELAELEGGKNEGCRAKSLLTAMERVVQRVWETMARRGCAREEVKAGKVRIAAAP
jgi:hypothetical protein